MSLPRRESGCCRCFTSSNTCRAGRVRCLLPIRHVELVFDALRNPNNLEILREIVKAAGEHGGHVAVSTIPENMNARRWIHELERVGRAGVIMVTSRLTPRATEAVARSGAAARADRSDQFSRRARAERWCNELARRRNCGAAPLGVGPSAYCDAPRL